MKKIITMILTFALIITGIAVPSETAKAEMTPYPEDSYVEAEDDPVEAEETEDPEDDEEINNLEDGKPERKSIISKFNVFGSKRYSNGQTIPVTKDFTESLKLYGYSKNVKWTSSDPKVVAIQTKPVINNKKYCVIKGKKYGTVTLTAEYEGQTTTVTVKVVKNQYSCKVKDLKPFTTFEITIKKKIGSGLTGVTSAKFNKKGNLVVKYYKKYTKWTKYGKKNTRRSVKSTNNKTHIEVYNEKGKRVIEYAKKTGNGKTLSVQHPKQSGTVVIPKKYLKGKKIDLRRCDYDYTNSYTG